jgi:hypothetical protein
MYKKNYNNASSCGAGKFWRNESSHFLDGIRDIGFS